MGWVENSWWGGGQTMELIRRHKIYLAVSEGYRDYLCPATTTGAVAAVAPPVVVVKRWFVSQCSHNMLTTVVNRGEHFKAVDNVWWKYYCETFLRSVTWQQVGAPHKSERTVRALLRGLFSRWEGQKPAQNKLPNIVICAWIAPVFYSLTPEMS